MTQRHTWVLSRRAFIAAEAKRCGDAIGRASAPILTLAPQPQSLRSDRDEPWSNQEEFLAILAHELRNPLMPIRCALEVIDNARGDILVVERAHAIVKRQFALMVQLLDDMLAAGAVANGKMVINKESVDLHSVLKSAVEAVKPLIDAKQHKLELLLPLTPVHLQADATKLTQIVTNLLTNAVKYTPAGGFIRLSAQRDGERGEVQVRVLDTGIGIAATQLHRIFDMFVRGNDPNAESCARAGHRARVGASAGDSAWRQHQCRIAMGRDLAQSSCLRCQVERGKRTTINLRSAPVLSVLSVARRYSSITRFLRHTSSSALNLSSADTCSSDSTSRKSDSRRDLTIV